MEAADPFILVNNHNLAGSALEVRTFVCPQLQSYVSRCQPAVFFILVAYDTLEVFMFGTFGLLFTYKNIKDKSVTFGVGRTKLR
jgi:hypothetical protein